MQPYNSSHRRGRLLDGRRALVTGAGRGIGRAIALAFTDAGAVVGLVARTADELREVAEQVQRGGGRAAVFVADLARRDEALQMIMAARTALGPIEILVNNAGIGSAANPRRLVAFDDAFWDLTLAVNLTAPYLLCKAVLPEMLAAGWGRIINMASINARTGAIEASAYVASKHGLLGLTRSLALEVAANGITVNAICPGPVRTELGNRRIVQLARDRGISPEEYETSLTPMRRRLDPDEIAALALYLASDAAHGITGQAWNVCGGLVMS